MQAPAQAQEMGKTQVKTKFGPTQSQAKSFERFKLFKHEVIRIQCFHWLNITTSGNCILVLMLFLSGILFSQGKRKHIYAQGQEKGKKNILVLLLALVLALVLTPTSKPF